jgi:acetylornithine deacetylase/succinyl-diaminopimelate desuccinylase-like protein
MMLGADPQDILRTLAQVVNNRNLEVFYQRGGSSSDSTPSTEEIMSAVESVAEEMWLGVTVIPTMSMGATDGAKMRNAGIPSYGVSGLLSIATTCEFTAKMSGC